MASAPREWAGLRTEDGLPPAAGPDRAEWREDRRGVAISDLPAKPGPGSAWKANCWGTKVESSLQNHACGTNKGPIRKPKLTKKRTSSRSYRTPRFLRIYPEPQFRLSSPRREILADVPTRTLNAWGRGAGVQWQGFLMRCSLRIIGHNPLLKDCSSGI